MSHPSATDPTDASAFRPLGDWSAELLSPLVGAVFASSMVGRDAEDLELIHVSAGEAPAMPGGRVPFSLTFRSVRKDLPAAQGCRFLDHPSLGGSEVFLVPIGPDEAGMRYEAVFS